MLAAQKGVAVPHELSERMFDARRRSDSFFSLLGANSFYERPIPERHRIIFYVGHLEAFDWNLLNGNVFGVKSAHPEFDRLFAFGIDPVGGGLPTDLPSDWPSLDVVRDYVGRVRAALDTNLKKAFLDANSQVRDAFPLRTLLTVAVEHRLMHAETLAYMFHQLPLHMKVRPVALQTNSRLPGPPIVQRMVAVPPGVAKLGLARSSEAFGWDNEYEAHTVDVPAFEIDRYKVTNRQYLEFMAAGGYETRAFWNDDDWNWKTAHEISHPLFWKAAEDRSSRRTWQYRTMLCRTMFDELPFDAVPIALDWPVYVSQAEAAAYARWAGKSLPTEAEWQRGAYGIVDREPRADPWGSEAPNAEFNDDSNGEFGNFDFHRWDPVPVNAFPKGQSAVGVDGMLGNGWEWTSTAFAPFPGFEPFPFYRGYSADFFDGKHFVMKGGSALTAACMLRPTFRNWFQAHYQYVYAGFRCVCR
jgi:iron(II)-dependent oxidoreductase